VGARDLLTAEARDYFAECLIPLLHPPKDLSNAVLGEPDSAKKKRRNQPCLTLWPPPLPARRPPLANTNLAKISISSRIFSSGDEADSSGWDLL